MRRFAERGGGIRMMVIGMMFLCLWMAGTNFSHAAIKAKPGNATASINAKAGTVLREKASTSSKKIRTLRNNTKITVYYEVYTHRTRTDSRYHWYRIGVGEKKGYEIGRAHV
nr:SH3 domain-containing protein [uncultured Mogibacterium sp.]